MKQDLTIEIKVLDRETKAEMLPTVVAEINGDVSKLNGVIKHIVYTIQGMIDVDKSKMIGKIQDEEEV